MGQSLSFCRAMLKLLILGVTCAGVSYAYFCQPCDSFPCQTSACCESGEYETPNCGCCLQCAPLRGKSDNPRRAVDQFGYDLTLKKSDIPVAVCSTEEKNTCHCTSSSVIGPDGKSKGGCVPSRSPPTGCVEGATHGWCFLENVKNPLNGSENCFEDTSWSAVDGRFWSKMACTKEFRKKNCKEKEKITLEDIILPQKPIALETLPLDSLIMDSWDMDPPILPHPTSPPQPKVVEILTTCPESQSELRGTKCEDGLTCSYGSQPCCGKTSPAREFSCNGGEMTERSICCLGCPGPHTTINPFLRTTTRELELEKNTEPECNCPGLVQAKFVCGSDGVTYP